MPAGAAAVTPVQSVLRKDFSAWISSVAAQASTGAKWSPDSPAVQNQAGWGAFGSNIITVAPDGSGNFRTVQAAVDAVPYNNGQRVNILIKPGIYNEQVLIPWYKPYVTLQGQDAQATVITYSAWAGGLAPSGQPWGTFMSCTVCIDAEHFIANNVTFMNGAPPPDPKFNDGQATALRITGDMAAFFNCHFIGWQDTLCDHQGRHYFRNCYIEGSVDFIFGNGTSIYEECHIYARQAPSYGTITAQSRDGAGETTGFAFVRCNITGAGQVLLGRAWRPYSRVVYVWSYMDGSLMPQGWSDWGAPSNDLTVFYGQYMCWGPGAALGGRVPFSKILTDGQVAPFLDYSFVGAIDWLGLFPAGTLVTYALPAGDVYTQAPFYVPPALYGAQAPPPPPPPPPVPTTPPAPLTLNQIKWKLAKMYHNMMVKRYQAYMRKKYHDLFVAEYQKWLQKVQGRGPPPPGAHR